MGLYLHTVVLLATTTGATQIRSRLGSGFSEACPDPSIRKSNLNIETDEEDQDKYSGPPASPSNHPFWATKNGDLVKLGASKHTSVSDLSDPSWTFQELDSHGKGFHSTPVIDGSHNIYIATSTGCIYKLDHAGKALWSTQPGGPGALSTLALHQTHVYGTHSTGIAFALEMSTGIMKWREKFADSCDARSSVSIADGKVLVAGRSASLRGKLNLLGNEQVYCLNVDDGSPLWTFKTAVNMFNFMPSIVDDTAVVMDRAGGMYRLRLSNGTALWQTPINGPLAQSTGGIAVAEGTVYSTSNLQAMPKWGSFYGGRGVIRAHDLNTGIMSWERSFDLEANAAPAVMKRRNRINIIAGLGSNAGAALFQTGNKWEGKLVALDHEAGSEAWSWSPPVLESPSTQGHKAYDNCLTDSWSTPSIGADDTIYVGWQGGKVYAIHVGSAVEIQSSYDFASGIQSAPALAENMLVVGSCDRLAAFKKQNVM